MTIDRLIFYYSPFILGVIAMNVWRVRQPALKARSRTFYTMQLALLAIFAAEDYGLIRFPVHHSDARIALLMVLCIAAGCVASFAIWWQAKNRRPCRGRSSWRSSPCSRPGPWTPTCSFFIEAKRDDPSPSVTRRPRKCDRRYRVHKTQNHDELQRKPEGPSRRKCPRDAVRRLSGLSGSASRWRAI